MQLCCSEPGESSATMAQYAAFHDGDVHELKYLLRKHGMGSKIQYCGGEFEPSTRLAFVAELLVP
jgi:hypothetical protein